MSRLGAWGWGQPWSPGAGLPWAEVLVWMLGAVSVQAASGGGGAAAAAGGQQLGLTRALQDEYAKEKEEQERRHQVWFPLTSSPLGAGTTKPRTPLGQCQQLLPASTGCSQG